MTFRLGTLCLVAGLGVPGVLAGQAVEWGALPTGRVIERVTSPSDSVEHYALYLPSDYTSERTWPLLVLMDPRGRALVPLALARAAAERLGYVVVSSYNTASDGPPTPNERAFQAILEDLLPRLSLDRHRFYFAGMSGTARQAWEFAYRLPGTAAGVVGFAAGLPVPLDRLVSTYGELPRFAFFGGVGRLDFNYQEVRALAGTLAGADVAHRIVYYHAPHGWPPAPIFDAALLWMERRAVLMHESTRDTTRLDSAYDAALASAQAVDDRAPIATDARREMERLAQDEADFGARLGAVLDKIRQDRDESSAAAWAHELGVDALRTQAAGADTLVAESAERRLALAFTELSFYEERGYRSAGDNARALLVLQIADRIRPGTPQVCAKIAEIASALGRDVSCATPER